MESVQKMSNLLPRNLCNSDATMIGICNTCDRLDSIPKAKPSPLPTVAHVKTWARRVKIKLPCTIVKDSQRQLFEKEWGIWECDLQSDLPSAIVYGNDLGQRWP